MKKYYRESMRGEYPVYNRKEGSLNGSITSGVETAF
jgi:hypothetical protein